MSYADGWAAINLEMPDRIPRTEYSAQRHWDLVAAVTGIEVNVESPEEAKQRAGRAFAGPEGWNYDFHWSTGIGRAEFGECRTNMGHAVYAAGGVDYDDDIRSPFTTPEEVLRFDPYEALGPRDHSELVRRFEGMYRRNCENQPDGVNMTGIYVICISGLIDLYGWELLLLAAGTDPALFGEMTDRYAAWIQQYL